MIKKEREKHHKELIIELEDIELNEKNLLEGESKYLVDYLYGISDIDKDVNNYLLELSLEDEWVVFYRCILRAKYLKGNYDKYKYIDRNIFLIRNVQDFENWKKIVLSEKKVDRDIDEESNEIIEKILETFKIEKISKTLDFENQFKDLLNVYILYSNDKKSQKYEKAVYELDKFLKKEYKNKNIFFNKTRLFDEILKINRDTINNIRKKYSEEIGNGE